MPKIEPAFFFCSRVSLQFLLVTSLCVIDCSVREWDVAVAMLTLGKSALPMQLKKSDLHFQELQSLSRSPSPLFVSSHPHVARLAGF